MYMYVCDLTEAKRAAAVLLMCCSAQIEKYSISTGQRSVFLSNIHQPRGVATSGLKLYYSDPLYETITEVRGRRLRSV